MPLNSRVHVPWFLPGCDTILIETGIKSVDSLNLWCYCNRKWVLAARHSKANKDASLVERKVCFILDTSYGVGGGWWRADACPKANSLPPPPDNQGAGAFIHRGKALHAETAQSALTVILKLVISGPTSIISIVLGTVNLQFQGWFVSISLRPILGIAAAYVMATACHHVVNFFHLVWVSVSTRQLTGHGPEYDL